MCDKNKNFPENEEQQNINDNWPEETVQNILDYIEEQGIYIRE